MDKSVLNEEFVQGVILLGGGEKGFHQDRIEETYDTIAQDYDRLMITMGHPDPE